MFGSRILSGVNPGRFIYPPDFRWSRQKGRSGFSLAAGTGCCDSGEEVKLWGCFSKALLVPGWIPGRSLAAALGRVATLEAQRDEFLLADNAGGVARSASRDSEFSLAVAAVFLFLLLRGCKRLRSLG